MANAVIVADMLRGFLEEDKPLYCGPTARRIIPNIQRLLEQELAQGSKVFFVADHHDPDDLEFRMFPPHSVAGTPETEVIPELRIYPGELIPKKRYSCFFGTDLDARLRTLKPDKLIICGVCTHICILYTVADARSRDYTVEVPVDCVATFDPKAHSFALEQIEKVWGAKLTSVTGVTKPRFVIEPSIISGDTSDIYFVRTVEILKKEGLNPLATMEVFPSEDGILCGMEEVRALLAQVLPEGSEVWALGEGEAFRRKEAVLRITAPYQSYGIYETAYLGMLSQMSGWATASKEIVEAAQGIPVICFGARHVHPLVAGRMEYAAIVGGVAGCSCIEGARLAGREPRGTIPHALIICMGDTVTATLAFDRHMPPQVPRVSLVDTFKDEPEESIIVARALGGRLQGVRLDTPTERGRVTPELVKETRARLDQVGFGGVGIFVSGGLSAERIRQFIAEGAPVDGFGVGHYISGAVPIDFTADIHQINGQPVAKRGRIPGITANPRLKRVM